MLERIFLRLYIFAESLKALIIRVICNKRASAKIPKRILDELARCFLPDIIAYYETVEGREEYKEWKCSNPANAPERATEPLKAKFRR